MIRAAKARWNGVALVCAKCEKKLDGGFGADGDQRLSRLLAKAAGGGKGGKAAWGVVRVPCLKLCPKRAVAVVDAARPRDWLVVAPGTPVAEVAARLGMVAPDGDGRAAPAPAQAGLPGAPHRPTP